MTDLSDATYVSLVRRIRDGDVAAFEALFRTLHPSLCDFANGLVKSPSLSEEIVQDVFLAVWLKRAGWNPTTSARAYLFGAVRNRAIEAMRRRGLSTRAELRSPGELRRATSGASPPTPHRELERSEAAAAVRVAGARGYEVQVHSQFSDYSAFADTTITLNGLTKSSDGQFAFIAQMTNQLIVSAVDSNYFDYFRRGADPFSGISAVSHLKGALGVFGAIVELQRMNLVVH